jgi:predicted metal-dependent phosphoesterase TrpH
MARSAATPAAGRVDLHLHSTCSDGRLDPVGLVTEVQRAGMLGLALTDHDTLAGLPAAAAAASAAGLLFVPGTELTCEFEGAEIHLLGYGLDPTHGPLLEAMAEEAEIRKSRAHNILQRLARMGIHLELGELRQSPGPIGRPHIAEALVQRGVCRDLKAAFELYLGNRGAAFAPRPRRPLAATIRLLHDSGAFAVLAHPGSTLGPEKLLALQRMGLDGIEVAHPRHGEDTERSLRRLAAKFGLLATCGSDFHGLPGQELGRPSTPLEVAEPLAAGRPSLSRASHSLP